MIRFHHIPQNEIFQSSHLEKERYGKSAEKVVCWRGWLAAGCGFLDFCGKDVRAFLLLLPNEVCYVQSHCGKYGAELCTTSPYCDQEYRLEQSTHCFVRTDSHRMDPSIQDLHSLQMARQ